MKLAILSIFPELFDPFFGTSLIGKAVSRGELTPTVINPRDFAHPPHFQVDDVPYGGGGGMLMRPEPLVAAIRSAKAECPRAPVVYLSAAGAPFSQTIARELSTHDELILLCGRYEGIDHRVISLEVDREISLGDFVLMGGEVAAMAVTEAVVRLIPGIIGNEQSLANESFSFSAEDPLLLEAPHYTRPAEFEGHRVPDVLLSGNHRLIQGWREKEGRSRTADRRPDLLKKKIKE